MPPPLNPQGSRAGLITAVVILSILFVTAAVFAFYFSSENTKSTQTLTELRKNVTKYASEDTWADPAVAALADDPNANGRSAIQVAIDQNKALTQLIGGKAPQGGNAKAAAEAQIKTLASDNDLKATGVAVTPGDGLLDVMNRLATSTKKLFTETQEKDKQLADATEKVKQETALRQKAQAEAQGKFDEQATVLATSASQFTSGREANEKSVATVQQESERALKAAQDELSKATQGIAERDAKNAQLQEEIKRLQTRVKRPERTKESILRESDGQIVRVPGNDNVFINLGQGSGIAEGLTFEVYDRYGGVPGLGAEPDAGSGVEIPDGELPKGKASIEVVRLIGPEQAECRITRITGGQTLIEGDLIANIAYDRNTKLNFLVFGDFDLDRDEIATPGDADVIRDRIKKWGGKLMDQVNVDTDIVVLGYEPIVPPTEENETPTDIARREAAVNALQAYDAVRNRAIELNIPILNQNRFLYYTGYYEQSQR